MKKNIVFLVVDCFDYNRIGGTAYRRSATPFLDSLRGKGYWAEKMYSQAPFTEGAMMATHCGYDTLDRGGYLKRYMNCPETLFEMMHRGGYRVYAQTWPHFSPSSAMRGIDDLKLRANSFEALWVYRLQYYAQLLQEGNLEQADIADLADLLRDNLNFWLEYLRLLENRDPVLEMVLKYSIQPPTQQDQRILQEQIQIFESDPGAYVTDLLTKGRSHILFTLHDDECMNNKVPREFVQKIATRYRELNRRIYKTSNRYNRINNPPKLRAMADYFRRSERPLDLRQRTQFSQYLRNYYQITRQTGLLERIGPEYDKVKDGISLRSMLQMFLDWEENRGDDTPYFAYIHNDDIHGPSAFFDYCSTDEEAIGASMDAITDYLDTLPANYRGNLGYDLGVLNVDRQIRWFYEELERKGILENSILVITSDHGCGTNYYPLRGYVQNFHDECYHVPFILCGAGISPMTDDAFHLTKDVMATMADLADISLPESATGISVFAAEKRECIYQEYMGPGCPDLYRRPIWMCAFDRRWKVFIKVKLLQETFDYAVEEIYDREKDPEERHNLSRSADAKHQVEHLLQVLYQRWQTIRGEYTRG